jgi:hypothetical protein
MLIGHSFSNSTFSERIFLRLLHEQKYSSWNNTTSHEYDDTILGIIYVVARMNVFSYMNGF